MTTAAAPQSWRDLAALMGVHERTLRKMRTQRGGPDAVDVDAWLRWCRANFPAGAKRLLAYHAQVPQLRLDARATDLDADLVSRIQDEITTSDDAKRRKAAADAALAEVKLQRELRRLLPTDAIVRLVEGLAGDVIGQLRDGVWLALLPHLDGLSTDHRRLLRAAHDHAITDIRARLTSDAQSRIHDLLLDGA